MRERAQTRRRERHPRRNEALVAGDHAGASAPRSEQPRVTAPGARPRSSIPSPYARPTSSVWMARTDPRFARSKKRKHPISPTPTSRPERRSVTSDPHPRRRTEVAVAVRVQLRAELGHAVLVDHLRGGDAEHAAIACEDLRTRHVAVVAFAATGIDDEAFRRQAPAPGAGVGPVGEPKERRRDGQEHDRRAGRDDVIEGGGETCDVDTAVAEKRRHRRVVVGRAQPRHHLAERGRRVRGPLRRGDQEAPPHARRQDRTRESGECRRAVHADVGDVVLGAALETGGGAAAAIHALRRAAGEDAHAERLRGDGRDLAPRARRRRRARSTKRRYAGFDRYW